jgi:hypothetical protein
MLGRLTPQPQNELVVSGEGAGPFGTAPFLEGLLDRFLDGRCVFCVFLTAEESRHASTMIGVEFRRSNRPQTPRRLTFGIQKNASRPRPPRCRPPGLARGIGLPFRSGESLQPAASAPFGKQRQYRALRIGCQRLQRHLVPLIRPQNTVFSHLLAHAHTVTAVMRSFPPIHKSTAIMWEHEKSPHQGLDNARGLNDNSAN